MAVYSRTEQLTLENLTEKMVVGILSDVHLMSRKSVSALEEAIDVINSADVDLVFLLGDYVSNRMHDVSPLKLFADLESRYGVYGVLGNHDYHASHLYMFPDQEFADRLVMSLEDAGVAVLVDESVQLDLDGDLVNLVGVDYRPDMAQAYSDVDPAYPTLLLAHNPEAVLELEDEHRTDIILSGHTHGYAIRLPGGQNHLLPYVPTRLGRNYDKGLKEYDGRLMYITSGIGGSPWVPRIFNPPEVVFLELVPGEKETSS